MGCQDNGINKAAAAAANEWAILQRMPGNTVSFTDSFTE